MHVWMVRASRYGAQEAPALENGLAVIGWEEMPDLSQATSKTLMRDLCRRVYPDASEPKLNNYVGQLFSFVHRIACGDLVALPRKSTSTIALGRVTGPYQYREDLGQVHHVRPVTWVRADIPRTDGAQDLLYSLGAFMTVCRLTRNRAEERVQQLLNGQKDPGWSDAEVATGGATREDEPSDHAAPTDVERLAEDQILRHIETHFKGHHLARLVEAVLQAEGYQTQLSPPGPDGGVDILAGTGALGFESPRLCVQVKPSGTPSDVTVFRGLQGTMATFKADQGLLVCWGGFNHTALREARLSFFSVRLWDAADLVAAILRNYERLPKEFQAELPLKRLWALVLEE
jgi:restriction system protein